MNTKVMTTKGRHEDMNIREQSIEVMHYQLYCGTISL